MTTSGWCHLPAPAVASWQTEPARVERRLTCFRQTSPAWPPLWHNAGEPVPSQEPGRFHRQGEGYCQYLSVTAFGAWAECARFYSIRSADRAGELRRNLWVVHVDEENLADLSSLDRYDACGLDPRIAVGDHGESQALADELRDAGYRGLLSPSAALPGSVNLSLFGERYERVILHTDLERLRALLARALGPGA